MTDLFNNFCLFIGPQKTGTTSISNTLLDHPEVLFPAAKKETFFFDQKFSRGSQYFESMFRPGEKPAHRMAAEVAPSYFASREAIDNVYALAPEARIVVTLRHPVKRLISHYLHHAARGTERRPFSQAVRGNPELLRSCQYERVIGEWRERFGRDRVEVLFFERMVENPEAYFDRIAGLMGINPMLPWPYNPNGDNTAIEPRFGLMSKAAAQVSRTLRRWDVDWVVNGAQRLGLKQMLYRGKTRGGSQTVGEDAVADASELLREEVQWYEAQLGQVVAMHGGDANDA